MKTAMNRKTHGFSVSAARPGSSADPAVATTGNKASYIDDLGETGWLPPSPGLCM